MPSHFALDGLEQLGCGVGLGGHDASESLRLRRGNVPAAFESCLCGD